MPHLKAIQLQDFLQQTANDYGWIRARLRQLPLDKESLIVHDVTLIREFNNSELYKMHVKLSLFYPDSIHAETIYVQVFLYDNEFIQLCQLLVAHGALREE